MKKTFNYIKRNWVTILLIMTVAANIYQQYNYSILKESTAKALMFERAVEAFRFEEYLIARGYGARVIMRDMEEFKAETDSIYGYFIEE